MVKKTQKEEGHRYNLETNNKDIATARHKSWLQVDHIAYMFIACQL